MPDSHRAITVLNGGPSFFDYPFRGASDSLAAVNDIQSSSGVGFGTSPGAGQRRGFWFLFFTQFQGAFSDNVYRTLAMFLIIGMPLPHFSGDSRELRMALVGALFALPFILFSMAGGYLADRFSKRTVTIGVKVLEVFIMLLVTAGLAWHQAPILLAGVFMMGTHSAFFGPSKYGLLPELLPEKRLSWGNGVLELGTFVSIIGGTVAGAWLCKTFAGRQVCAWN